MIGTFSRWADFSIASLSGGSFLDTLGMPAYDTPVSGMTSH
jgi:hypothetical protein